MPEVPEEIREFAVKLDTEGFHYCLTEYSNWKELEAINPQLYAEILLYRQIAGAIVKRLKEKYDLELGRN